MLDLLTRNLKSDSQHCEQLDDDCVAIFFK